MALHTPVHQLGTTHHPHTLRYAFALVVAAIVVVALLVVADVVKIAPTTSSPAADRFMSQTMIEFRAQERSLVAPFTYNGPH